MNKTIMIGALVLMVVLIAFLGGIFVVARRQVTNMAVDSCLKQAQIQTQDGKTKIITPENYWYNLCMKEKGYK